MSKIYISGLWLNRILAAVLIPTAIALYLFGAVVWGESMKAIGKRK